MQSNEPTKPELQTIITTQFSNGIGAAIAKFLEVNKVNCFKGTKSDMPALDFANLFTAEFDSDPEVQKKFPFTSSFRVGIDAVVIDAKEGLELLYDTNDIEMLERLCRVLGYGEALNYLDAHRFEVIKLVNDIRGDDIIPKSKIIKLEDN